MVCVHFVRAISFIGWKCQCTALTVSKLKHFVLKHWWVTNLAQVMLHHTGGLGAGAPMLKKRCSESALLESPIVDKTW